ncbi:hypothetical protein SAMN05660206_11715 [Sphingobacterium wenxiniae]|uniref:Uncharacterized protein n=1 Tax=Sphingobacterium wenxiniae TaxID=683125 RepID=A0A1I6VT62_9SPHI|nr:hypothetical protein SAMN05660206_11715 [Sphingobacterium wenxiniae]
MEFFFVHFMSSEAGQAFSTFDRKSGAKLVAEKL